jgi:hypothetical protein
MFQFNKTLIKQKGEGKLSGVLVYELLENVTCASGKQMENFDTDQEGSELLKREFIYMCAFIF